MHGLLSGSFALFATAAIAAAASTAVSAQADFPAGPVRIVVPIPAGASADTLPRIVAKQLSEQWRQPVVIENRPGAAQNLGAEIVARARPDGYTLLATPQGPLTISQSFFKDMRFDPAAFAPVGLFARQPLVLVSSPRLPAGSFKELIAFAKAHPGKLNFASPGIGSSPHLTGEMLQAEAQIKFTHVPYKGLAPAMVDLLAGRVELMIDNLPNVISHIRDGGVKPLAVLEPARIAALPDVPAAAETLPGFHVASWFAIVAPPGTPPAIIERVSQSLTTALKAPAVVAQFQAMSSEPVLMSPAESAEFIKAEAERWHRLIVDQHLGSN